MTTSQSQHKFISIRCPKCKGVLFNITSAAAPFSIRVRCNRCSGNRRRSVYRVLEISLESMLKIGLDLESEKFSSA